MQNLFGFLFFISFCSLIAGLIKPTLFSKFLGENVDRRKIRYVFLSTTVVFFFLLGVFDTPKQKEEVVNNTEQATEQVENISTEKEEIIEQPIVIETLEPDLVVAELNEDVVVNNSPQAQEPKPVVQQEQTIPAPSVQDTPQYEYYSVSSVVDGDTIKVNINGTIETLRLIGMDTPETVDPRKPVQCFGQEASNKAKELLSSKKVRLEKDLMTGEIDKYGRLLAYVYREDGLFYNKHMIEQGYAHEYTYNTPYKYQTEFKAAQKSAQDNLRGLWSPDTCNGDTTTVADDVTTNEIEVSTIKYYTSSYHTAKYYYPAACLEWQDLSPKYLQSFDSLEALLAAYPSRTLSPQCQ